MKFTAYATRLEGRTAYLHGGKAIDLDLQGGLEEVMESLILNGTKRIVLTLADMKFFHYTFLAGLLATQQKLSRVGGDLILADIPWWVRQTLRDLKIIDRFAIVPSAETVERAERLRFNLDDIPGGTIPG